MVYSIKKKSWPRCKESVLELYDSNNYLTPYTDFQFLNTIKSFPNIHKIKEYLQCKFLCYTLEKNRKVIAVVPVYVNVKNKKIYLLGHFTSVGHIDFIYGPKFSHGDFDNLILLMKRQHPGFTLVLDRISQYSLTYRFLNEIGLNLISSKCVRIDIDHGYDDWYSSLKKSCRQNIRTSYNRLQKDECEYSCVMYIREKPNKKLRNDNISLLSKRIIEHSNLRKELYVPMLILKKHEPLTKALFDSKDSIFSSIYINGVLAATCNGVIAHDGRAIITRLSIDITFGKYSPGGLLINEMVKECSDKYQFIKSIDLSRGAEPYKYTYGGYEHFNYSCELMLE